MIDLIEKENLPSNSKIAKPDFNTKAGREFLSFYLQAKIKQLMLHDKKEKMPIIIEAKPNFVGNFAKRLVNNYNRRILISVTGESASGKTTVCKKLQEIVDLYNMPVEILSADNYFNDISDKVKVAGGFDNLMKTGFETDAPSNFQLELLKDDLHKLASGVDIKAPKYVIDGSGVSVPNAIPVKSRKIVVVEGTCTSYSDVPEFFDIKIYVEADKDERKRRFLARGKERNQPPEACLKHWNYVNRAAEQYILPARAIADVVINGYSDLEYYGQFFSYLYKITNNFAKE